MLVGIYCKNKQYHIFKIRYNRDTSKQKMVFGVIDKQTHEIIVKLLIKSLK